MLGVGAETVGGTVSFFLLLLLFALGADVDMEASRGGGTGGGEFALAAAPI